MESILDRQLDLQWVSKQNSKALMWCTLYHKNNTRHINTIEFLEFKVHTYEWITLDHMLRLLRDWMYTALQYLTLFHEWLDFLVQLPMPTC